MRDFLIPPGDYGVTANPYSPSGGGPAPSAYPPGMVWVTDGAGGGSFQPLGSSQPILGVAATVTASGALVVNKHNPVDATSGPLTMTLPTGQSQGSLIVAEKFDSSVNAVNVSGNIRGSSGSTIGLVLTHEAILFEADTSGSWWPISGHKLLSTLDARYVPIVPGIVADNGATDNTAAIVAAAALGPVTLPIGSIGCDLSITGTLLTAGLIRGKHRALTRLVGVTSKAGTQHAVVDMVNPNLRLEELTVDGGTNPAATVAAGSNGATLTSLVGGSLLVSSTTNWAASGQFTVVTSGGTATLSYTSVTGGATPSLNGIAIASGTGTWTVATGAAVSSLTLTACLYGIYINANPVSLHRVLWTGGTIANMFEDVGSGSNEYSFCVSGSGGGSKTVRAFAGTLATTAGLSAISDSGNGFGPADINRLIEGTNIPQGTVISSNKKGTVSVGSNGASLTSLVGGSLLVSSTFNWLSTGGQFTVVTSGGTATLSYTSITGGGAPSLNGIAIVSGTGTWTVATGAAVTSLTTVGIDQPATGTTTTGSATVFQGCGTVFLGNDQRVASCVFGSGPTRLGGGGGLITGTHITFLNPTGSGGLSSVLFEGSWKMSGCYFDSCPSGAQVGGAGGPTVVGANIVHKVGGNQSSLTGCNFYQNASISNPVMFVENDTVTSISITGGTVNNSKPWGSLFNLTAGANNNFSVYELWVASGATTNIFAGGSGTTSAPVSVNIAGTRTTLNVALVRDIQSLTPDDGVTETSTANDAAMLAWEQSLPSSGGTGILPAGRYRFNNYQPGQAHPNKKLTIYGQGGGDATDPGATIILGPLTGTATAPWILGNATANGGTASFGNNIFLDHMSFDGGTNCLSGLVIDANDVEVGDDVYIHNGTQVSLNQTPNCNRNTIGTIQVNNAPSTFTLGTQTVTISGGTTFTITDGTSSPPPVGTQLTGAGIPLGTVVSSITTPGVNGVYVVDQASTNAAGIVVTSYGYDCAWLFGTDTIIKGGARFKQGVKRLGGSGNQLESCHLTFTTQTGAAGLSNVLLEGAWSISNPYFDSSPTGGGSNLVHKKGAPHCSISNSKWFQNSNNTNSPMFTENDGTNSVSFNGGVVTPDTAAKAFSALFNLTVANPAFNVPDPLYVGPNAVQTTSGTPNMFTGANVGPATVIFGGQTYSGTAGTKVVAVPATTVAVAAVSYPRTFYVTNGSASSTFALSNGPTITLPASAVLAIRVPPGVTLTPTYTVAPTWVVEGE